MLHRCEIGIERLHLLRCFFRSDSLRFRVQRCGKNPLAIQPGSLVPACRIKQSPRHDDDRPPLLNEFAEQRNHPFVRSFQSGDHHEPCGFQKFLSDLIGTHVLNVNQTALRLVAAGPWCHQVTQGIRLTNPILFEILVAAKRVHKNDGKRCNNRNHDLLSIVGGQLVRRLQFRLNNDSCHHRPGLERIGHHVELVSEFHFTRLACRHLHCLAGDFGPIDQQSSLNLE